MGLVAGVGIYQEGKYSSRSGKNKSTEYQLWSNMIRRCYSPAYKRLTDAYEGCIVDQRFINFQEFMLWAEVQVGYGEKDYQLDKDLLSDNCKIYSPETCVFVPKEINTLLNNCPTQKGTGATGTRFWGKTYTTSLTVNNKTVKVGQFDTEELAFEAYKIAKEANVRRVAEKYKDRIDQRVYCKLINYKLPILVDINKE